MFKMVTKTSITKKGQVTIPKRIREYLGVKTKDKLEFKIEKGKVIVQPATSLEANFGRVRPQQKPENFMKIRKSFEEGIAKEVSKET